LISLKPPRIRDTLACKTLVIDNDGNENNNKKFYAKSNFTLLFTGMNYRRDKKIEYEILIIFTKDEIKKKKRVKQR